MNAAAILALIQALAPVAEALTVEGAQLIGAVLAAVAAAPASHQAAVSTAAIAAAKITTTAS